jgi:hypothetical protein
MERHSVPGLPKYRAFRTREGVEEYVSKDLEGEYVVKADGLCGGKGVKVRLCLVTLVDGHAVLIFSAPLLSLSLPLFLCLSVFLSVCLSVCLSLSLSLSLYVYM